MGNGSYLDLYTKNTKPKFFLCRPDKTIVHPLNDVYGLNYRGNLGGMSELEFNIPTLVRRNDKTVINPLFEKLQGHYLIRMDKDGQTDYFTITDRAKSYNTNDAFTSVMAYSLVYELIQKPIRSYEKEASPLRVLGSDILSGTNWSIDYIDGEIDLLYRSINIASANILQSMLDLADKFGCLIEFDNVNRKMSFKKYENVGFNRGFVARDEKYLESFNLQIDDKQVITRLYAYGQDGLTFRALTANGTNYIEDYSWFMYPFQADENYNVLRKSKFMSDELCIALLKYDKLLESTRPTFESLLAQQTSADTSLRTRQQELSVLQTELNIINGEIDVINYNYGINGEEAVGRPDWQNAQIRKNNKQSEIDSKKSQITANESLITNINTQISNLRNTIDTKNNFTVAQLTELNYFTRAETYTNEAIVDPKDLLAEAKLVFEDYKQPPLNLTMSIEVFTKFFDTTKYKRIELGDPITLYSKSMDVDVSAKVTSIGINYDTNEKTITVSNVRNNYTGEELEARIQVDNINATSTVNLDKYKWNKGEYAETLVNQIIESNYDTAKKVLLGGYENSVEITERGLYTRDLNDSNTYLVINNGMLAITADGGNSVAVAISKNGVIADRLVGRVILGNNLIIESNSGITQLNGDTITIRDNVGNLKLQAGKYTDPNNSSITKYGLYIPNGSIDIRSTSTPNRGIQMDDMGYRAFNSNGVRTFDVNAQTGLVSIIGSLNIKTTDATNRGVVFDGNGISAYNSSGTRTFYVDTNGNLTANSGTFTGIINATGGTISGNLTVTGTLTGGSFSGGSFTSGTFTSGTIQSTTINAGTINGTTINSATINSATINITDDVRIGARLILQSKNSEIWFDSSINSINASGGGLNFFTIGTLGIVGSRINIGMGPATVIDFSGSTSANAQNFSVGFATSSGTSTRSSTADYASSATRADDADNARNSLYVRGLYLAYNDTFVYIRDQFGTDVAQLRRSDT